MERLNTAQTEVFNLILHFTIKLIQTVLKTNHRRWSGLRERLKAKLSANMTGPSVARTDCDDECLMWCGVVWCGVVWVSDQLYWWWWAPSCPVSSGHSLSCLSGLWSGDWKLELLILCRVNSEGRCLIQTWSSAFIFCSSLMIYDISCCI